MMQFSINYSTQAAVLLTVGRLKIDRFKCPDWPSLINEAMKFRPVSVHFTLSAGRGKLASKDLDLIRQIANQTETPYINLHLESKLRDFPDMAVDSKNPELHNRIRSQTLRDVETVIKQFGRKRVIIENIPYRPTGKVFRLCTEPEFIHEIISETGCGFLLDIPHARITALNLQVDEKDYLSSLPVHALKEMHFTGVHAFGNWLQDHLPPEPDDWLALDWVLERIRQGTWPEPWMLAYEVGGVGEKFFWRTQAQAMERDSKRIFNSISEI